MKTILFILPVLSFSFISLSCSENTINDLPFYAPEGGEEGIVSDYLIPPEGGEIEFVDYHINRSNGGLEAWDIGLETNKIAYFRDVSDFYSQYNPPNWIVLTDETCNGEGIPPSLKGGRCVFGDEKVVGFAQYRLGADNFILDTTTMIKMSFQENDNMPDFIKRVVYTHEIGHALGLNHVDDWLLKTGDIDHRNYIMYSKATTNTSPHTDELNAIKSVYDNLDGNVSYGDLVPEGEDSNGNPYFNYFNNFNIVASDGTYRRVYSHKKLPVFHIYPAAPTSSNHSLSLKKRAKRGKKLDFTPKVVNFYLYKDGSSKEEHIGEEGNVIIKHIKEHHNHSIKDSKAHHHNHVRKRPNKNWNILLKHMPTLN